LGRFRAKVPSVDHHEVPWWAIWTDTTINFVLVNAMMQTCRKIIQNYTPITFKNKSPVWKKGPFLWCHHWQPSLLYQFPAPFSPSQVELQQVDKAGYSGPYTLPKTNIAPENGWLEYYLPFGMAYFQVLC